MNESPLSIEETNEVLNAIKSVDLSTIGKPEMESLIVRLSKHMSIVGSIPQGSVIIRSVSCNYLKENPISIYPLTVEQLSFNPDLESCGFNRASWKEESAFYGSIATNKLQPYHTSSFEVLSDLQNSSNDIDRETFVVGKWVASKDIPLVHISGELKNNALVASSRNDTLYKSLSHYPEHMIPLKMIDTYLCSEFVKEVPSDEKWRYKVSAAYAGFIKKDNWPGLMYPSLKSDGAGYNVALFPDTLYDYVTFERAALMTYYKRGKSISNEITMEAFPDGKLLRWKEFYKGHMFPPMKKWYLGLSDDNSFERYLDYANL